MGEMAIENNGAALEYREFSFAYPTKGDNESIRDAVHPPIVGPIDWHIERGSFVVLTGATGIGKTTLLRCAKPEVSPVGDRSGDIFVMGANTANLSPLQSAEAIGYVSQSPDNQLVCDTVWHQIAFSLENLGMGQGEMRRRVAEVAHFFNIEPWFNRDVNALSGGQKQLVNLASVLVMQPRVLLLDEPCAQLDSVAERNFLHALFRLNREIGMTVVMATHAPEVAQPYATDCLTLEQGIIRRIERGGQAADAKMNGEFSAGFGAANAACGVENERPAVIGAERACAVGVADVRFRYGRGEAWVLRGFNLQVQTGSIHALVGGNGSGKSTILGLIAGTIKPEGGKVTNRLRDDQAFLPQNPKALFVCDTVADELREWQKGCGYTDADVDAALDRIGICDCEERHPYDLSGGQQQLLALAKLLLTRPRLLLLDEPTKGLDARNKVEVARLLAEYRAKGGTILMATHDLTIVAALADEVSLVFDGQIAATEPTFAFFERNLFYRLQPDAFWGMWQSK